MKPDYANVPLEILEAANKISNFVKMRGWKSGWTLCGLADRHAYEELLEYFKYYKDNSTFKDPYEFEL